MSEGKCAFCDFEVVSRDFDGDEEYSYMEGSPADPVDDDGVSSIFLAKTDDYGDGAFLYIDIDDEWEEEVPYSIGGGEGIANIRAGFECHDGFEVKFCPMCGREL